MKSNESGRDLGEQPIMKVMEKYHLSHHDLVAASTEQITHKMISRACKGRRLTRRVQIKVLNALNAATDGNYRLEDVFSY